MFEEVLLDLCIGQADAELVRHTFFPLIAHLVATRTLLGEAADFGLSAEPGCEGTDGFPPILHHPTQGHPGHLGILLPYGQCSDGLEQILFCQFLERYGADAVAGDIPPELGVTAL